MEKPVSALLRERQVLEHFLPVSHSTLWAMVQRGQFPSPIKLSAGVTAWKLAEIEEWLNTSTISRRRGAA